MEFYFDIEFINSLVNAKLSEDIFDDFKMFIKKLNDSKVYVYLQESPVFTEIEVNPFYRVLIDNGANFLYQKDKELIAILEDEMTTGFKYFFLNKIFSIETIKDDYGFFAINIEKLNATWQILLSTRDDLKKYIHKDRDKFHFTKWSELNEFIFPLNSLVISDRFLFSSEIDIENNLIKLLNNIGLKKLGKRKVDIVIYSSNYFGEGDQNIKFNKAFEIVNEELSKILGENNYNFTLLRLDKNTNPTDKELHYRVLFTNVLFINPGHSFTFFEKVRLSLVPKVGEYFSIDFFVHSRTRGVNKAPIELLNKGFLKVCNEPIKQKVSIHNNKVIRLFN